MAKSKPTKIGRDARIGQFILVKKAIQRPNTSVVETISKPKPKKGK